MRERLFSLLDRSSRIAWVSAPAGAGKSSLVSSWIEARRLGVVWYEVDAGDADPATLFHYLGLAARAASTRRGVALPHLTPEYLRNLEVFVRCFFEKFFACFKAPAVLVFDNCDEVPHQSLFHSIVDGALHAVAPGVKVICVSREEPPAALARWRADSGFQSVGWDDLKLTDGEAHGLAQLGGMHDGHDLIGMNALARGWAVGLKLLLEAQSAGLEVGIVGDTTPKLLFDYFAREVFDRARPELRDFLIKTAVLPSFTAEMARHVSGHEAAEETLAWLHRNHHFTDRRIYANASPVFEYHPLIREFLLERTRRELSPAEFSARQQRAALLLEEIGQVDSAASLWRSARDWPALERLICQQAPVLQAQDRLALVEEWIQAMPHAMRNAAPWLLYWLGTCRSFSDPALGRQSLEQAYAQFKAEGEMTGSFLALAGIVTGYFHQWSEMKPLDRWIAEFEELLTANGGIVPAAAETQIVGSCLGVLFRRPDHPILPAVAERAEALMATHPDASERFAMAGFAIHYFIWRGEFARANALCESILQTPNHNVSVYLRVNFGLVRGLLKWEEAEHETAVAALNDALDLGRASGMHLLDARLYFHLSNTALSAGDIDAAEQALDNAKPFIHPERKLDISHYGFLRAGVLHARGRQKEAIEVAAISLQLLVDAGSPFREATFRIQFGQMLMLDGQHRAARENFDLALQLGRRMSSNILEFRALLSLAYSHLESGEDDAGLNTLSAALAIGSRRNLMNCHPLWIPQIMRRLCAHAVRSGIELECVRQLIRFRRLAAPDECLDAEGWPWQVRIYTLGRFAVVIDGDPLRHPTKAQRKPLDLLKALIAHGGRSVSLGVLVGELWPELVSDAGQNAFHLALHRLRRLLVVKDALALHEGKLSFDPHHLWVDAWAFERLVGQAESFVNGGSDLDESRGRALAARLLKLYAGHFLREDEVPWAAAQRERLRSKFLRTVAMLGGVLERAKGLDEAIDLYRRALELDALAEEFHRGLMRCLATLGRVAEALDAYRRCRDILSITLGVAPSAATQAVYRALSN